MINPIKNTPVVPSISVNEEVKNPTESSVESVAKRSMEEMQTTGSSSSSMSEIVPESVPTKIRFLDQDSAVALQFFADLGSNKEKQIFICNYFDKKYPSQKVGFIRPSSRPGLSVSTIYDPSGRKLMHTVLPTKEAWEAATKSQQIQFEQEHQTRMKEGLEIQYDELVSIEKMITHPPVEGVSKKSMEELQTTGSSSSSMSEIVAESVPTKIRFLDQDSAVAPQFFADLGTNKEKETFIRTYFDNKYPSQKVWFMRPSSRPGVSVLTIYDPSAGKLMHTRLPTKEAWEAATKSQQTQFEQQHQNQIKEGLGIQYDELVSIEKMITQPPKPSSPEEIKNIMERNFDRAQVVCGKISDEEKQALNTKLREALKQTNIEIEDVDIVYLIQNAWESYEQSKTNFIDRSGKIKQLHEDAIKKYQDALNKGEKTGLTSMFKNLLESNKKKLNDFTETREKLELRKCEPLPAKEMNGYTIDIIEEKARGEDASLATDIRLDGHKGNLYAVFDGHGGSAVANYLKDHLASTLQESFQKIQEPLDFTTKLYTALNDATEELNRHILSNEAMNEMGSTLTGVLCINERVYAFNLGDSAAYAVKKDKSVIRMTTPDAPGALVSLLNAQSISPTDVSSLLSTPASCLKWRTKNGLQVNGSMGDGDQADDFHRTLTISILPDEIRAEDVDIFLASDGLHDKVKVEEYLKFAVEKGLEAATNHVFQDTGKNEYLPDDLTVIRARWSGSSSSSSSSEGSS